MEHQFLQPHCPEHSSVSTQHCRFIHLGFLITIRYLLTQECYTEFQFSSVQSLSCVWLFANPWIAAHQASLSITNSQSSLKLTSIESVMPSSHLILCRPLLLLPPIAPSIRVFFQWVNSSHKVAKVLEFQPQHQFTNVQNPYSLKYEPMGPERVYGCSFCLHKVDCNTMSEQSSLDWIRSSGTHGKSTSQRWLTLDKSFTQMLQMRLSVLEQVPASHWLPNGVK